MAHLTLHRDSRVVHTDLTSDRTRSVYTCRRKHREYLVSRSRAGNYQFWAVWERRNPIDSFVGWRRTLEGVRQRIRDLEERYEHRATGNPFPPEAEAR